LSADAAKARRIVAQHAMTSALLGVEFVPLARALQPKADADQGSATKKMRALQAKYEREAPHKDFDTDFNSIVFGDGDPCARLMFIGEAPGADEDRLGKPFVGRSGQLLNKMIAAMGLSREGVYIANVLKTRPPGNATPTADEVKACKPYLLEQIRIVDPEVIVTLGLPAARCLLESNDSMGNLRNRFHEFEVSPGKVIPVMPTYHPAYLLRSYTPENRKKVWSDLQMVLDRLGMSPASA